MPETKTPTQNIKPVCKNCIYYEPDYGIFCVNGWSKDGSKGYCNLEPKKIFVAGTRIGCRYYERKGA